MKVLKEIRWLFIIAGLFILGSIINTVVDLITFTFKIITL